MGIVRLSISMSLDGYVAGPDQGLEQPLGAGGEKLHEWAVATRTFRALHGGEGGETGVDDERAAAILGGVGATIMGRNMFGPVRGPWAEPAWSGWWGDEPPYRSPVFVLTHHPRAPLTLGRTTFHFVTDGIEAALERARAAAGDADVSIGGGAATARQYLRAGLVDEVELHVAPVLLGAGERLLEDLGDGARDLEAAGIVSSPAAAHVRLARGAA
ncbi:MAG: dihydrofolate reductase family protein [Thermoleophilia bacterium]